MGATINNESTTTNPLLFILQKPQPLQGLINFTSQNFALDSAAVKIAISLAHVEASVLFQCIIMGNQSKQLI